MKQSVAFLTGDPRQAHNDNHVRLPAAFEHMGWAVVTADHDDLRVEDHQVFAAGHTLASFDLVWPVGFGPHRTFADRMHILSTLPRRLVINPVDALTLRHGKLFLAEYMPESLVSADAEHLISRLGHGDWVIKPLAGSYGRGVARVAAGAEGEAQIRELAEGGFCVLQRYVDTIATHGEVRSLFAAGQIVGTYRRIQGPLGTTNLAAGGRACHHQLSPGEEALTQRIAQRLTQLGIRWAAIDIAGGQLMEVNLANPGGLATLAELGAQQATQDLVRHIGAALLSGD